MSVGYRLLWVFQHQILTHVAELVMIRLQLVSKWQIPSVRATGGFTTRITTVHTSIIEQRENCWNPFHPIEINKMYFPSINTIDRIEADYHYTAYRVNMFCLICCILYSYLLR